MWLTTPGNTLNIYNFIFTPNHFFHHHNLFSIILGHHSTSLVRLRLKEAHGLPSGKVTNRAGSAPALSFNLKWTRPLRDTPPQGHARSWTRPLVDTPTQGQGPCAQVHAPHLQSMLRILSLRSKISTKAITSIDSERDVTYFLVGLSLSTCLENKCPEGWTYTLIQFCSVSSVFTNTKKYVVTGFFLRTHVQMGGH